MDTDLIHQFCSVIESGTVAKAAEVLHMTPGALSRALKRLENELDVELFTPSGRNIVPTSAAKRFYPMGKELLQNLTNSKTALKTLTHKTSPLRIATYEVFSSHFMASFIANEGLDRDFSLTEKTPGAIEDSIKYGSADIGITYVPFLDTELDHLLIGKMEIGVFCNSQHKSVDLPFAIPITDIGQNILHAHSLDGWPQDVPRKIKYRFELLETALDLASRGVCKICCPKFLIKIENERFKTEFKLVEESVEKSIRINPLKVYLVKRKSDPESTEIKKLAKRLRMILAL